MNPLILSFFVLLSCQTKRNPAEVVTAKTIPLSSAQVLDTATFAGGCFWCVEASFEQIQGVAEAVSGYAGGAATTANYRMVSAGLTQHAEAVQVYYDPQVIDYETLLDIFFTAHDPTQLNRQGPDVGAQYRSEIFYHNEDQRLAAESKIKALAPSYAQRIVTKVSRLSGFYMAEAYHQDYEVNHPDHPYIKNVSKPKIDRVAEKFREIVKKGKDG